MCVPPFVIYITLGLFSALLIIISIFYAHSVSYMAAAFAFAIAQSRIKCPKCKNSILKSPSGWYLFSMRSICRHCGQDTMRCTIEQDDTTQARVKGEQR